MVKHQPFTECLETVTQSTTASVLYPGIAINTCACVINLSILLLAENTKINISSVAQLYPTLCDPEDCSTPGLPVHHQLPELAISVESWWCHPTISSSVVPFLPSIFPSIRVFSNELALCIRWPKYWSFSISPSNEYSGLISFRIHWFDLFAVQETLTSLLQHHSLKISIVSVLSLLYGPTLTSLHDCWKNHKEVKSC